LAYYRFDGDATDSSFNDLDGIEVGNISYVDGVIGQALKLDGSSRINLESFSNEDVARGLTYSYCLCTTRAFPLVIPVPLSPISEGLFLHLL